MDYLEIEPGAQIEVKRSASGLLKAVGTKLLILLGTCPQRPGLKCVSTWMLETAAWVCIVENECARNTFNKH